MQKPHQSSPGANYNPRHIHLPWFLSKSHWIQSSGVRPKKQNFSHQLTLFLCTLKSQNHCFRINWKNNVQSCLDQASYISSGNLLQKPRGPGAPSFNLPPLKPLLLPCSLSLTSYHMVWYSSTFANYSVDLPPDCWKTPIFWKLTKMSSPLCRKASPSLVCVCSHYTSISIVVFNISYYNYGSTVCFFNRI